MSEVFRPYNLGRYRVIRPLGSGGMADVLLAEMRGARSFSRLVTIKRIRAVHEQEPDFVNMFVDEANLLTRVRHPNVVSVLDLQEEENCLFMVMEYVDGCDFTQLLQSVRSANRKVPVHLALFVTWCVLRGLVQAHNATSSTGEPLHLIHRDVSPGNVLLGGDGSVKLSDFGIAKAMGRLTRTAAGVVKGKVRYMAPEMMRFSTLDQRCDLWGVGVMLWETLALRRLFRGNNDLETIQAVMNMEVPPPSSVNPMVPPAVDELVMKSLQRDPALRFQTSLEMEQALYAAMGGKHPDMLARDLSSLMTTYDVKRETSVIDDPTVVTAPSDPDLHDDDFFAGFLTPSSESAPAPGSEPLPSSWTSLFEASEQSNRKR